MVAAAEKNTMAAARNPKSWRSLSWRNKTATATSAAAGNAAMAAPVNGFVRSTDQSGCISRTSPSQIGQIAGSTIAIGPRMHCGSSSSRHRQRTHAGAEHRGNPRDTIAMAQPAGERQQQPAADRGRRGVDRDGIAKLAHPMLRADADAERQRREQRQRNAVPSERDASVAIDDIAQRQRQAACREIWQALRCRSPAGRRSAHRPHSRTTMCGPTMPPPPRSAA